MAIQGTYNINLQEANLIVSHNIIMTILAWKHISVNKMYTALHNCNVPSWNLPNLGPRITILAQV